MTSPFSSRLALLGALLGVLLAGAATPCSAARRTAKAATAARPQTLPTAAQLAALVFPTWNPSHTGRMQTVALPQGSASYANWGNGQARVIVEPKLVLQTDTEHLTLVAGMVPASEDGKPAIAHMTPMGLAAYQFTRASGGWKVSGRQGLFAWRGFFGEASLRQVALTTSPRGGRQAVGVEYGSCWDGYCGTWLALYELDNGTVRREPAVELALAGNNIDGAPDCMRRLQPLHPTRPQDGTMHDDGSPPGAHDCYAIESTWSIEPARDQPGDLSVRYQGAMSRADSYAGPPVAVDQRQVLRYGSGKYRAIAGFDPVPPI